MAKRGQNEGSIYKRPDGRWTSVINLGYQGGRLKRQYFYGKTREEVAGKLTEALQKRRQGLPVTFERQTVAQFLDRWLNDCVKPSVRPKTYYSYSQLVRLYLKPQLGHVNLEKLMPQHVQKFMNECLQSGLSPRTVQYLRAVLRRALNQALQWGLVSRNVATLVNPPRRVKPQITPLNSEEAHRFLEAVKGDRLEALYSVALALGLRQGEALGMRWEDVDLDSRTLRIAVALQRIERKLRLTEVKTDDSLRTLPLPNKLVESLRAHRSRQLQEKLIAGERWQECGLVFTSGIGSPLDARNVVRQFHRHLKSAGISRRRFHDLRHSTASLLLARGESMRMIMEILRHSQISITMDLYAHIAPEMKREAIDHMDAILA